MGTAATILTAANTRGLKSASAVAIIIVEEEIYINTVPSIETYKRAKNWVAVTFDRIIQLSPFPIFP